MAARPGKKTSARHIELYGSTYGLAWKQISALQKREQPNIALRLHAAIRRQIENGEIDPLFIVSKALRDCR